MTSILWINVLLAVPFIAAVGRHPAVAGAEALGPQAAGTVAMPAVRTLPEPRVHAAYRRAA